MHIHVFIAWCHTHFHHLKMFIYSPFDIISLFSRFLETTDLSSICCFFSFAQSQIYKLVQYFAFQFSCFHLSKMNLIPLSVIAKASICPFWLPNNTPHSLWIHLPIGKFLGYFQNGEIIRLFLTLNVQFFCAYKFLTLLGMYVRVRKMSHMSILYSIL